MSTIRGLMQGQALMLSTATLDYQPLDLLTGLRSGGRTPAGQPPSIRAPRSTVVEQRRVLALARHRACTVCHTAYHTPLCPMASHPLSSDLPHLSLVEARRSCIPGRSVAEPVNAMPPASKAASTSKSVWVRPGGIPSTASRRIIVRALTPDFSAKSSMDQFKAARAARICAPTIIDKPSVVV
jgi:hypothetical protein